LQSQDNVTHLIAERMEDLTPMLGLLSERDVKIDATARADEVRRPPPEGDPRAGKAPRRPPQPDAPASAPPLDVEEREVVRAMPGGRNFH